VVERDKLVRVMAESDLRVGMLVVVKSCRRCARDHRHLITGLEKRRHSHKGETPSQCGHVLCRVPGETCTGAPRTCWSFAIPDGRLYRVDAGLTDEANPYVAVNIPKPARVSR